MNPTRIIAHRGASYDAPENTQAAFSEAWKQGADGIEGDYCLTADGHIVCIHDDDTERTGGRKLIVADTNLQELQQLEYGSWKAPRFQGEPLPTIADVLANVPSGKWNVIELKTGPEIILPLKRQLEIAETDLERLLVIAFDWRTIAESKRLLPTVKAHWLTDYRQNDDESWSPSAAEIIDVIRRCQADGLGSENRPSVVTRQFVEELRAAGIAEFHVWTVDQPSDAAYFCELGAWGITTNRPGFLLQLDCFGQKLV